MQNGILQGRLTWAAIQADSVHGRDSKVALVMQNGILQNGFSGAADQADSMHGVRGNQSAKQK